MFLDPMKDHLIPHTSKKKMMKEMFNTIVSLYQSGNINRKMILYNRLKSINITISYTLTNYPMKIMEIHDQIVVFEEKVQYTNLVNMVLNGFLNSRETICQRYFFSG